MKGVNVSIALDPYSVGRDIAIFLTILKLSHACPISWDAILCIWAIGLALGLLLIVAFAVLFTEKEH